MSVFTFNGYAHPEDEVGIKMDNRVIEDAHKKPLIRVMRWTIVGAIRSDGSSGAMQTRIQAMEDNYGDGDKNYGDATFTANGHTHTMPNSTSFSGVRVASFGWMTGPWKMHTELSNRRAFYIVLQAEYRFSNEIISYREEVQQIGTGGPKWRFMPSLTGAPVGQILQAATPVKYIQRGILVKRTATPAIPTALFPNSVIHHDETRLTQHAPQSITTNGSGQVEEVYALEWIYVAEAVSSISLGTFNIPTL